MKTMKHNAKNEKLSVNDNDGKDVKILRPVIIVYITSTCLPYKNSTEKY